MQHVTDVICHTATHTGQTGDGEGFDFHFFLRKVLENGAD